MKRTIITAAMATALVWLAAPAPLVAQGGNADKASASRGPRMADGHPDLSGVWWRGADVGGRPSPTAAAPAAGRGGTPAGGRGAAPPTFAGLYTLLLQKQKAKTLGDKDDPSLGCVPTAFGTLNVSLFDVGAVGQIVQTPVFVVMLTETYHGSLNYPDRWTSSSRHRAAILSRRCRWSLGRRYAGGGQDELYRTTTGSLRKAGDILSIPTPSCTWWSAIAGQMRPRLRSKRPFTIPRS